MMPLRAIGLFVLAALAHARMHAQLVVDGGLSPEAIVQNVLLGTGITASNITFNGASASTPNEQVARFYGSNCVLQLDSGLLMATGDATVALGPNNSGSMQVEVFDNFFADNDLDNVAGDMAMDIACIEFDFVPSGDSISFAYSFASEEYLEWVNSIYNDAFGFFLSGPGIFGPFDNDAVNLAIAPGTLNYVSVNTINQQLNAAHYQDNGDGFTAPYSTNPYYFQFDGFTTGLVARAAVQCGQTYHIKLAIGDVGDPNWDSGVFIVGGSFTATGGSSISITTASGNAAAMEGCDQAVVTITRAGTAGEVVVPISASGNASSTDDISGLPATVTIPDGTSSVSFTIDIPVDGLVEGSELLELCAQIPGACGGGDSTCASIVIVDAPPILLSGVDAISDCSGTPIGLSAEVSGGTGTIGLSWSHGDAGASITVPDAAATYTLTATDDCGMEASLSLSVIAPCGITIPNVFTPNGDGANDLFVIEGIERIANSVRIYNRWGNLVFEANNYRNTWDGGDVSDGTYYYEVIAQGFEEPFTGHLTILSNSY